MVENAHLVALLCLESGRMEDAAEIIAANIGLSEALGIGLLDARQGKIAEMTATARAALGDARFREAEIAGQAMDIDVLTRRIALVARGIVGPRQAPVSVDLLPMAPVDAPGTTHRLTERELEILRLLAAGRSTAEIAEELFVSARTVTTHVAHILEKLQMPNRTAAVAYAMREGLV
jgi:DNA-binding NarL/FixJ family response regulator